MASLRSARLSKARLRRWSVTGLGVALVWSSMGFSAYALAWESHKNHAQTTLLQREHGVIARTAAQTHGAACVVTGQQPGELSGILSIPALKLSAPVEEGTDDAELDVAVGHDPQSVWPGANGAAVLLAHDASYFVHLDALKPGDVITYQTACTTAKFVVSGQQIVAAGSDVSNTSNASLVLDTCYPPDALFYTPQRLLIRAGEVDESMTGVTAAAGPPPVAPTYTSTAPPALVAQGLTLQQNEAPMGTMQLVDSTRVFAQSPRPLSLEAAALEAYFGGLHAGAQRQLSWWQALAPGIPLPPQLDGATVTGHDAPLNVEIDSTGGTPSRVVLRTTVTLAGGSSPGAHAETVTLPVHGSVVTVGSWQLL
jgi:sortase A